MQLTIPEAVNLLNIPEGTIKRWIRQGAIPCVYREGRYLFDLETLRIWATSKGLIVSSDKISILKSENLTKDSDVIASIRRGQIHYDLEIQTKAESFEMIQGLLAHTVPSAFQIAALLQKRENIASTSIGNGIAIPHVLRPLTQLQQPLISVCFPKQALIERQQHIFVLFVLISTTLDNHLKLLLELAQTLKSQKIVNQLQKEPSFESIAAIFGNFEIF